MQVKERLVFGVAGKLGLGENQRGPLDFDGDTLAGSETRAAAQAGAQDRAGIQT